MKLFGKRVFLEKIHEMTSDFKTIQGLVCTYRRISPFGEWLEFEYGNYYYVFYHARRWGSNRIIYRKRYFNVFIGRQTGEAQFGELTKQNENVA